MKYYLNHTYISNIGIEKIACYLIRIKHKKNIVVVTSINIKKVSRFLTITLKLKKKVKIKNQILINIKKHKNDH